MKKTQLFDVPVVSSNNLFSMSLWSWFDFIYVPIFEVSLFPPKRWRRNSREKKIYSCFINVTVIVTQEGKMN